MMSISGLVVGQLLQPLGGTYPPSGAWGSLYTETTSTRGKWPSRGQDIPLIHFHDGVRECVSCAGCADWTPEKAGVGHGFHPVAP